MSSKICPIAGNPLLQYFDLICLILCLASGEADSIKIIILLNHISKHLPRNSNLYRLISY